MRAMASTGWAAGVRTSSLLDESLSSNFLLFYIWSMEKKVMRNYSESPETH